MVKHIQLQVLLCYSSHSSTVIWRTNTLKLLLPIVFFKLPRLEHVLYFDTCLIFDFDIDTCTIIYRMNYLPN